MRNGAKKVLQILPFQQITAKDEFLNVKAASRDDVLAVHRVPATDGGDAGRKSAFGDVEKGRARFYAINELMPVMEGHEAASMTGLAKRGSAFNPYALLDTQPTS